MCEFEFRFWKLGEFTENKTGHILKLMDEIWNEYFSLKINREKSLFHFEKQNLEHIGNSAHTTEYLTFGKALLARLYLKVKVCIIKLPC